MIGPVFHLLGPVGARDGDREIRIGAPRLRTLLAGLLLNVNRTVTAAELTDWVWGDDPPAEPQRALYTAVFRLRAKLGPDLGERIRTVAGGYRIDAGTDELDLTAFRALVAAAIGSTEQAAAQLTAALALWSGEPLTGIVDNPAVEARRAGLREEWLRVTEQLIDARLLLGEHAQLTVELTALTGQHPLRERFWAQLMLALHRSGRQADALASYHQLATVLREELGIDPGGEVERLHLSILAGEPAGDAPEDKWEPHWQLPLDVGDFVGRHKLGDMLAARLTETSTVPVVAITGPPGVGKTALAVRVAHRLRAHFPDGQWYMRLDGATTPRDPGDVLVDLLGLCGISPAAVPAGLDARAARLRSLLADRRVLIVLDDAQHAQQVRPLLPGTPGSAVLVTSRSELSALSVLDGAQRTSLEVLEPSEAIRLLGLMLGPERVGRESAAAAEVVRLCGYLPLALRIAAGQLAERPDQPIAGYAEDLRTGDRLAQLAIGDHPEAAVATAFESSYQALPPDAQRLFSLLGVTAGPDLTVSVAAALLDDSAQRAGRLLDSLVAANLLQRQSDRYRMHDLLRLYARQRAETEAGADEAWERLCDWYLRTADAAVQFDFLPFVRLTERQQPVAGFDDADQATAWLEAEIDNLVACIGRAAVTGPHRFAWKLADILRDFLWDFQRVVAWRQAVVAGLAAARTAADRGGEGAMLHGLGMLHFLVGEDAAAIDALESAVVCYADAGFRIGEGALLCNLGMAHDDQGNSRRAADLLRRGIDGLRLLGRPEALTSALISLSNVHCNLGELDAAVARAEEALRLAPETHRRLRTLALFNRGAAYRLRRDLDRADADFTEALRSVDDTVPLHYEAALLYVELGRLNEAADCARRAVTRSRQHSLAWHEAAALNALGAVSRARGDWTGAGQQHEAALTIADQHGHRGTLAEALLGLAATALGRRDLALAREQGARALELARQLEHRITEDRALQVLAEADDRENTPLTAR